MILDRCTVESLSKLMWNKLPFDLLTKQCKSCNTVHISIVFFLTGFTRKCRRELFVLLRYWQAEPPTHTAVETYHRETSHRSSSMFCNSRAYASNASEKLALLFSEKNHCLPSIFFSKKKTEVMFFRSFDCLPLELILDNMYLANIYNTTELQHFYGESLNLIFHCYVWLFFKVVVAVVNFSIQ